MAWIESHQSLGAHPKTRKLARKLGVSIPQAVGHLQFLWWWALDYAPDGDLSRFEDEDIADAVLWDGTASVLIASLLDAGFLENPGAARIHDWDEYVGRLLDKRAANAERARKSREGSKGSARNVRATNAQRAVLPTEPTVPTKPTEENQPAAAYYGVQIPPPLRDRVIEHCEAIPSRFRDSETVEAVLLLHAEVPPEQIDLARTAIRRDPKSHIPFPARVRAELPQEKKKGPYYGEEGIFAGID